VNLWELPMNWMRVALGAGATGGIGAAAWIQPSLLLVAGVGIVAVVTAVLLLAILVLGGVVLPAVWSRSPDRRTAAAAVLAQLLLALWWRGRR